MNLLSNIPATFRILVVFVLILFLIKKKLSLGNSFLIGSVLLGAIFGMAPLEIMQSTLLSLVHPKTLALSILVGLILVLSHSMERVGQMKRLLDNFQGLIRHGGVNLIIFPALIGLLPMPGGAVFSAPMVKSIGHRQRLEAAQLSYTNYWFRHIWEYWWPLYPGILLATTLAQLDLWDFILCLAPLSLVAVVSGFWPLRRLRSGGQDLASGEGRQEHRAAVGPFLVELTPIVIVVGLGLGLGSLLSLVWEYRSIEVSKEIGLIVALGVAIYMVWHRHRNALSKRDRLGLIFRPQLIGMFYMVTTIMIFKGILGDSDAVLLVSRELMDWKIPLVSICIILPFLVGGIAGITVAFVGTTFPIIISLVTALGQEHLLLPYLMLALCSGFMGVMLSPLHLCLLLSNEYFKTSALAVYRCLWAPCTAMLLGAVGYFWVLKLYMG
jgi:integral membrane protein (TIGR00529 family)